jgi:Rrf2 family cysteine metabolism transcriptional repressor
VRLMHEVHLRGGRDKPVKLADVSKATGVSLKFLGQLVISLKTHGLLRGICGRNGGYVLGREAEEITIGDVLRSVIGPIDLSVCASDSNICMSGEFCESRLMWRLLRQQIHHLLDAHTVADLANEEWRERVRGELVEFDSSSLAARRPRASQREPAEAQ